MIIDHEELMKWARAQAVGRPVRLEVRHEIIYALPLFSEVVFARVYLRDRRRRCSWDTDAMRECGPIAEKRLA